MGTVSVAPETSGNVYVKDTEVTVIAKVPAEYLLAMYESGKCPANVQEYVEQNMAELHLRAERDGRCRNALKSMYL